MMMMHSRKGDNGSLQRTMRKLSLEMEATLVPLNILNFCDLGWSSALFEKGMGQLEVRAFHFGREPYRAVGEGKCVVPESLSPTVTLWIVASSQSRHKGAYLTLRQNVHGSIPSGKIGEQQIGIPG